MTKKEEKDQKEREEKKQFYWVLVGFFVAFCVQVLYDMIGVVFSSSFKIVVGFSICIVLGLILFVATNRIFNNNKKNLRLFPSNRGQTKDSKMSEDDKPVPNAEDWKKRIEPLIEKVDHECKKRVLTPIKEVAVWLIIGFYIVALVFLSYELLTILSGFASYIGALKTAEEILGFLVNQEVGYVALGVGIVAVVFSIFPVILAFPKTTSGELADYYYNGSWWRRGLSMNTPKNDRPYLKALINMKCKEFDLMLSHIYHSNPNLFSEESLLKSLYLG